MKIEAVILYSTNDFRFINTCINQLLKCDIKCHIITYSHMWNGTLEDEILLNKTITSYKDNSLVNFYKIDWEPNKSPWYWEGLGRYLGTQEVSPSSDFILYIDSDEIIDSDIFFEELEKNNFSKYNAIGLYGYWYWREPIYQSTTTEYTGTMVKTELAKQLPLMEGGRNYYFNSISPQVIIGKKNPIIHHYSWVRTKNEMLNKVKNWGHCNDRQNWVECIEEEFTHPFNGKDFVHNYEYIKVNNKFDIKI